MKIQTFGLATVAALLISQLSAPLPSNSTATSAYTLDQATFSLTQTNSMLAFEIHDKDPLAIDKILIDGLALTPDQKGIYEYDMEQQLEVEVVLSSDSASSLDKSDPMRHIASRTFPVRNLGLADAAVAQSTSATRTRIRYQTFIGRDFVQAKLLCFGFYVNVPNATYFNGNNRSWNADSDSYKTRFDSVITWGAKPAVNKEVSVGLTTVYLGLPPFVIPETSQRASAESMQLNTTVLSPDYVSFGIKQNVPNPFCFGADGINFDLHFYVRRDGVYTLTGNYLPVPFHEVYARDNVDTSWRQIMRSGFEVFECFTPIIGNLCDVNNLSQRSAF
jgi:hypothetical protein